MKLGTEIKITITTNDYSITIRYKKAIINNLNANMKIAELTVEKLSTGILMYDLSLFTGYKFLDKDNNFFDTIDKRIYFNNGTAFIGDKNEKDEKAFSLFENFDEIENKIIEINNNRNFEYKDEDKKKIADEMLNELKKALESYKFEKIKLKYGRYCELETPEGKKGIKFVNDSYKYLKGNRMEIIYNKKK